MTSTRSCARAGIDGESCLPWGCEPDHYCANESGVLTCRPLHYDNGFVKIDTEPRTGRLRVAHRRISGWVSHHRFVCKLNAAATIPIYEALGATDVRYEARACVSEGDPHCEWLVRWVDGE